MFPADLLILSLLVGVGAWVRLSGLSAFYLSPDEALIIRIADLPDLNAIWRELQSQDHPLLPYLILHYLNLLNPALITLRLYSILPGLFLIPVFYLIGKEIEGRAAGLGMAFWAAFGQAALIQSQVLRPYSIFLLVWALAIYFSLAAVRSDKTSHWFTLSLLLLLLTGLHYSAALALPGCLAVLFFSSNAAPWRRRAKALAAVAPTLAMMAILYMTNISKIGENYATWRTEYLARGFAGPRGILNEALLLPAYFFHPKAAVVVLIMLCLGFIRFWKKGRKELLLMVSVPVALNIILSQTDAYPFMASRHLIYLFPLLAAMAAAPIQWLADFFQRHTAGVRLEIGAYALVVILTALVGLGYRREAFLRAFPANRWSEFPLLDTSYNAVLNEARAKVRSGEIIIGSYQTACYLYHETRAAQNLGPLLRRINWEGRWFYYFEGEWRMNDRARVLDLVAMIRARHDPSATNRLWALNIGARCSIVPFAAP